MSSSMSGYAGYGTKPKIPGYNIIATPTMDPRTTEYRQRLLDNSQPGLDAGVKRLSALAAGDQSQFDALEKPAFEDFQRGLGMIGSRYAGTGSGQMSARGSSAFQNETTGAAGDLAAKLQAQRMDIQNNALSELRGISQDILGSSPYEYGLQPKKKKRKWWQTGIDAAVTGGGAVLGGFLGGPAGAAAGLQAGSAFTNGLWE